MRELRRTAPGNDSATVRLLQAGSEREQGVASRFWSKVRKTETCWFWTGASFTASRGGPSYGAFRLEGKIKKAHAVAWLLTNGSLPDGAHVFCHKCNTPSCVRPEHLYVGTRAENRKDMLVAGRKWCPGMRLSEAQRAELHQRLKNGESVLALAREFGITRQSIHRQRQGLGLGTP